MKMASPKFQCLAAWLAIITFSLPFAGCAPGDSQSDPQASAQLEALRAENEQLQDLRRENQELPRLRKDNEEARRLRSEIDQIPSLRQEQEQLRAQLAQRGNRLSGSVVRRLDASANAAPPPIAVPPPGEPTDGNYSNLVDLPREGDEILIEPRLLGKLLPGFGWENIERKEPIAVRALLEQQGVVLTNYQQLADFGITNYIIHRPPPQQAAGEPGQ